MKRAVYDTKTLLDNLSESIRHQIKELTATYLNQPVSVLRRPAEDGGWSVVECLAHLNTYCSYYLPYINQEVIQQSKHRNQNYRATWLGNYSVSLMNNKAKKYKAKAIHQPLKAPDPYSTMKLYIDHQEKLLRCIELAYHADLNVGRIPMSILPWFKLSVGDVLHFIVIHQQRHLLQARRNFKSQSLTNSLSASLQ